MEEETTETTKQTKITKWNKPRNKKERNNSRRKRVFRIKIRSSLNTNYKISPLIHVSFLSNPEFSFPHIRQQPLTAFPVFASELIGI
jgi:hypothetical protein